MDRGASRPVTTSAKIDERALSGHKQTNNEYLEVGTNRICSGNGGRSVCRVSRVGEPQPLIEPPLPLCFSFYRPVSAPPHRSFVSLHLSLFVSILASLCSYTLQICLSTLPPRGRLRDVYNTRERFKTIREYKPALSQECRGGAAAWVMTDITRRARILIVLFFQKSLYCGCF